MNKSESKFDSEDGQIRFGLLAIKNVGFGAAESIVKAAREKPFASLDDLCARVDLHAINKTIESLAKAGLSTACVPPTRRPPRARGSWRTSTRWSAASRR